jgi:hypothetical protein
MHEGLAYDRAHGFRRLGSWAGYLEMMKNTYKYKCIIQRSLNLSMYMQWQINVIVIIHQSGSFYNTHTAILLYPTQALLLYLILLSVLSFAYGLSLGFYTPSYVLEILVSLAPSFLMPTDESYCQDVTHKYHNFSCTVHIFQSCQCSDFRFYPSCSFLNILQEYDFYCL